ncbi:unnamed protein product [Didymodactylos carnosus]|uniref:Uncharacterized protein n=1 Tax=Didymodactylos carnosus TaxID=1234261 RepID=A0A813WDE8_9BILA|nr:unnamed protein product [Didymodactylos carnosus]CAF0923363.1 unnamed protein product [Didymodactylos carnosus]CAF3636694.1 unnamed protein product [Didymodactylos carnosus]CAF3700540.1 unnamed protein product [Didymodactylos carnosus]
MLDRTKQAFICPHTTCKCSAVSDTVGFKFKGWDLSNCKFCGCTNAAMANCKQACIDTVSNYAKMGCGKLVGGSYVVPKHDAGSCSKGIHETKFKCAS